MEALITTNASEIASNMKELIYKGQTTLDELRRASIHSIQARWFPAINTAVVFTALQKLLLEA